MLKNKSECRAKPTTDLDYPRKIINIPHIDRAFLSVNNFAVNVKNEIWI